MVRRKQDQRLGDIAPCRLETLLVVAPCPAEQSAHVSIEHGERRIGQSDFKTRGLDNEDRGPPRRFEIGDVLDSHNRALVDQPSQAAGVDAPGARRVDSQLPRLFEAIQ
jgi:hypothetical protein